MGLSNWARPITFQQLLCDFDLCHWGDQLCWV
jgi:hypothetical protein